MPTYVAFLRAINLGATRKFSAAQITTDCQRVGCTEVTTHLNTGNVRLSTTLRSPAKIEALLERAFRDDRGFEVPTMVLSPAEIAQIVTDADEIGANHDQDIHHYVSVLKSVPSAEAASRLQAMSTDDERAHVRGRVAHLLLTSGYQKSRLTNTMVEKVLGVATNRNLTVMRAIVKKWC